MRDILSNMTITQGAPQTLSGTTPNASAAIDVRGYDALTAYLQTGTVTDAGAAAGFSAKIQHSDTLVGADFVDVPADEQKGAISDVTLDTADNITVPGGVSYLGNKRYVRTVITGTSGTNAVVQALFVLGKPHRAPTTPVGATSATT
jgi:hypothetical protein